MIALDMYDNPEKVKPEIVKLRSALLSFLSSLASQVAVKSLLQEIGRRIRERGKR